MKINEIKLSEFAPESNIPKDRYENLRSSIRMQGIVHALAITKSNILLDGYERYRVCKELGIEEVPVHIVDITNENDIKGWFLGKPNKYIQPMFKEYVRAVLRILTENPEISLNELAKKIEISVEHLQKNIIKYLKEVQ